MSNIMIKNQESKKRKKEKGKREKKKENEQQVSYVKVVRRASDTE